MLDRGRRSRSLRLPSYPVLETHGVREERPGSALVEGGRQLMKSIAPLVFPFAGGLCATLFLVTVWHVAGFAPPPMESVDYPFSKYFAGCFNVKFAVPFAL